MRTRYAAKGAKGWLTAIVMVSVLLLGTGLAGIAASLDEQLIEAAGQGNLARVRTLLGKGVSVDTRDNDGWTPLMWAAWKRHPDVVKLLLDQGADADARDNHGWTVIRRARFEGYVEMVDLLTELLRIRLNNR